MIAAVAQILTLIREWYLWQTMHHRRHKVFVACKEYLSLSQDRLTIGEQVEKASLSKRRITLVIKYYFIGKHGGVISGMHLKLILRLKTRLNAKPRPTNNYPNSHSKFVLFNFKRVYNKRHVLVICSLCVYTVPVSMRRFLLPPGSRAIVTNIRGVLFC